MTRARVLILERAEAVEMLDGLPDLVAPALLVVRVREALAPVAEVGRDHEQRARLRQVAREHASVVALGRAAQRAHQHRHHSEVVLSAPARRTCLREFSILGIYCTCTQTGY